MKTYAVTVFLATAVLAIRNGNGPAETSRYSYVVSIQSQKPAGTSHECGGVIIGVDHVLTSADCFGNRDGWLNRLVMAGSSNLKTGGSLHRIVKAHPHKGYDRKKDQIDSNIAIVRVSPPFNLSSWGTATRAVKLPSRDHHLAGVNAVLLGWGATDQEAAGLYRFSDDLQYIVLKTISNQHCNMYDLNVTNKQICTLAPVGKGSCYRDKGGPLVIANRHTSGNDLLVGILTERSYLSCGLGFPDIYTKVSAFVPWIKTNID